MTKDGRDAGPTELVQLQRLTLKDARRTPCMTCATAPCCTHMPVHQFTVRSLRDLDHAFYLLNFERIQLGLSITGDWSVYYRYPCQFLDRSNPGNYLCTIHDTPLQPRICVHYSPFSCWYKRALGGQSDDFLAIDRARLEAIAERLVFDDDRNIRGTRCATGRGSKKARPRTRTAPAGWDRASAR